MPAMSDSSLVHVEGSDDLHAISHLLARHDIACAIKGPPTGLPLIKSQGGVESLLAGMTVAVKTGTDKAIGFVLDGDSPLISRWAAVRRQLDQVGIETPETPPPAGFIAEASTYKTTVGVWLMPDNQQDGRLETLLRSLIDENDPLIDHATHATREAKRLGAKFSTPDLDKATLHAWLAWQKEPGAPYGTAIRARYFGADSPAARQFVAWFKRLFVIP